MKRKASSAAEVLPQHKPTNLSPEQTATLKSNKPIKSLCSAVVWMYIIRLCLFHPHVLSLFLPFIQPPIQDPTGYFTMHFVHLFLDLGRPFALAKGGAIVSAFGTTIL